MRFMIILSIRKVGRPSRTRGIVPLEVDGSVFAENLYPIAGKRVVTSSRLGLICT